LQPNDAAIAQLKTIMLGKEEQLKSAIAARVRDEGGALVGWMAGAYTARKILAVINAELDKVEPADSALRQGFEAWIEAEITRLETDPARAAALGRAIRSALQHPHQVHLQPSAQRIGKHANGSDKEYRGFRRFNG
jgi:hypothetical protein